MILATPESSRRSLKLGLGQPAASAVRAAGLEDQSKVAAGQIVEFQLGDRSEAFVPVLDPDLDLYLDFGLDHDLGLS